MEEENVSKADQAYEWTVRALYLGLIVGNLLVVWDAWKDTPGGIEWRARVGAWWRQKRECEPCNRRKEWLKAKAHMLWEATEIVESARREGE